MDDPNAPSMWLIMGLGMGLMGSFIFLLWAVNALKRWRQRPKRRSTHYAHSTPEIAPAPHPNPPSTVAHAAAMMPLRDWLDYVNHQPDRVPHIAAIGPSGAGKTALATAVLVDRPGHIVVITAKEGDGWGGLPYIGIDADASYRTAIRTFDELHAEVKRRLVDTKHNRMTAAWLTIVVDDFSTLVKEAPVAAEVVKLVARLGRSLRVRLVMLSDSALVKAIGLEGEGETRSNFAFIRIQRGHKATIEIDSAEVPIDTSLVAQLARQARLADRVWRTPRDPDDELADCLGLSVQEPAFSGVPDQTRPDQTEPSERTLMRKYRDAGLTRDQARNLFQADGLGFDNNAWAAMGKDITASA